MSNIAERGNFDTLQINLKRKEDWTVENASQIAKKMGYECDSGFMRLLTNFIEEIAAKSTIQSLLPSCFEGVLAVHAQELKRLPHSQQYLESLERFHAQQIQTGQRHRRGLASLFSGALYSRQSGLQKKVK